MCRFAAAGLVGGICLLSPAACGADQPQDARFLVGARSGYAWGGAVRAQGDLRASAIPIWLDLGYLLTPEVMLGAYAQYGIGVGSSVSARVLAFGAEVHYRFSPDETLHPWMGFGLGYQQLEMSHTDRAPGYGGEYTVSETIRGVDYAVLQGGFDVIAVGPFTSLSLGQDLACVYEEPGLRSGCPKGGLHGWWTLGLRAAFEL
jgi:hypothetical protein